MVQFVNLCAACCAISFSWDWGKKVCFEDQDGEKEKSSRYGEALKYDLQLLDNLVKF
jgi:hypothetical protein